ncbi:MAG: hypothetical protein J5779_01935 [Clostridia bacterium]|nr:hypothetical protein [Clostridia bacterium]
MRLYALLPNSLYLEKLHNNDRKFGRIIMDDLSSTPHAKFSILLDPFFEIWNKERFINSSILMFTTPAEMKNYLNSEYVGFAIETEDKVVNINGQKFIEFIHELFVENGEMFDEKADIDTFKEFLFKVSEKAEEYEAEMAKVDNFYDAFGIVDEININDIKTLYYLPNNSVIKKIKEDENKKIFNFVQVDKKELEQ